MRDLSRVWHRAAWSTPGRIKWYPPLELPLFPQVAP